MQQQRRTSAARSVAAFCLSCDEPAVYQDTWGHHWCEADQRRGQLIDYGVRAGYPCIACPPFAIGPDIECWEVLLFCSNDMITALWNVVYAASTVDDVALA